MDAPGKEGAAMPPRQAQGLLTLPEGALMTPLWSVTAYKGWLILEYPETVEGKPKSRFAIQNPPEGPIKAGTSLNGAKRAIDTSSVRGRCGRPASQAATGSPCASLPF